jgi:hypothetical protein
MTTKSEIILKIQIAADEEVGGVKHGAVAIRAAIGATGEYVEVNQEKKPTGSAWIPPAVFDKFVEGFAAYLDAQGVSQVGTIKTKVNELITQYNQLLSDHNANIRPSSAHTVATLP